MTYPGGWHCTTKGEEETASLERAGRQRFSSCPGPRPFPEQRTFGCFSRGPALLHLKKKLGISEPPPGNLQDSPAPTFADLPMGPASHMQGRGVPAFRMKTMTQRPLGG